MRRKCAKVFLRLGVVKYSRRMFVLVTNIASFSLEGFEGLPQHCRGRCEIFGYFICGGGK